MAAHEEDLIDYSDDEIPTTEAQPANGAAKKAAAANGAKGSTYSGIHTTSFKDMFLRPEIMKAINGCGFEHPSDVQQSAIPRAILQNDVICQAKSGLGKTAVFVISTLQQLEETGLDGEVQALVICHTRDLAYQIKNEFTRFAKYMTFVKIALFYGGVDIKEDEKVLADKKNFPNIVVGTPGRLHALVRDGKLRLGHLRFFIIDECDKVLDKTDMRQDVQAIFRTTPSKKQVMMFSATLSQEIRPICKKFMNNPHEIYVDDEKELTLHGLQQYRVKLNENEKNRKLNEVLDDLEYNQVMIFVKSQNRAIELTKLLREANFPAESAYGTLKQEERINTYNGFKNFDSRILVCTDVFARGVDFQRVNLVVNYDMPDTRNTSEKAITDDSISDSARTYLHRVGRAGRFGTKGVAISFIASEYDTQLLARIVEHQAIDIAEYPEGGQGVDLSSAANNA